MKDVKSPLIENLIQADEFYANGEPYMTDTEYDNMKEHVRVMYPDHPYFQTVGVLSTKGEKVKLPYILGSLNKVKIDDNTVYNFIKNKGKLIASHKLDGVSVLVEFNNGKVVFAATRGDGEYGQDITEKIKKIIRKITYKGNVILRGEMLLTGKDHLRMGFKTRRNGVAGLINRDDINIDDLMKIRVVFYELIYVDMDRFTNETEQVRLDFIGSLNLETVFYVFVPEYNSIDFLLDMYKKTKNLDYDCDGIVLTKNTSIRENVKYPENKVAFKVNTDAVRVNVVDVEWNIGRTGKITPTILIEETVIDGVEIRKATGFNYDFVATNGLGAGSKVGLIRSNSVIPYITEVFTKGKMNIPEKCPSCNGELIIDGVELLCNNKNCYESKVKKIAHYFKTMGSDFITETTIRNLGVSSIEEMYELDELEIASIEGFGIKKAEQVFYEIQKTLNTTPDKLLASFGISGIGKTLSTPILNKYNFDDLFTLVKIDNIEGIGEILSDNFVNEINNFKGLYTFLSERGLKFIEKEKSSITGMIFTLTGKMPLKRDVITKMITSKGGFVKGISKSTNYLVTDDTTSGSNKNEKAKEYGVEIISFETLLKMIE
jgi:DNA ligase (NAD+)